MKDWSSWRKD